MVLAGREYSVLWPPPRLDAEGTERLSRLLYDIEAVGAEHPEFDDVLREAYERKPFDPLRDSRLRPDTAEPVPLGEDDVDTPDDELGEGDEGAPGSRDGSGAPSVLPGRWTRDPAHKALIGRARSAKNDLSLVFHDPDRRGLVAFGDAPEWVVDRLAPSLGPGGYANMLAPHHGSHSTSPSTPRVCVCVAQGGRRMFPHWHANHVTTHACRCVNVHGRGTVRLPL